MKVRFNIDLTKSQQEAYDVIHKKEYKYIALNWSRQAGKSTLMKVLCLEWLLTTPFQIGYVCRNYILAKRFYKEILQLIPPQFVASANASDLTIATTFKSTLQFFSAESGNALRGLTFSYLIMDEFAFFPFSQTDGTHLWYDILSPTIKAKGRKVIWVSTPLGKNNTFYEVYNLPFGKGAGGDWRRRCVSMTKNIYEDGLVTPEQIEEIKSQVPELTFRQEYLCEFLDSSLTFFSGFEDCFLPTSKGYQKTWIGIDLSGNGQDETIVTKINEKNEVEVIPITGTLDVKYQLIANVINDAENLQAVYLENNGLGAPIINEIKKLVKNKNLLHEWHTSNTSKEEIVSQLAVQIAKKEISFDVNDSITYDQLATFTCKPSKTGKLTFAAQAGYHDDRVMATAIALRAKQDYKYDKNVYFNRKTNNFKLI